MLNPKWIGPVTACVLFALAVVPVHAQHQWQITPYAGGFWPTETLGDEDFKNDGLYGVRVGGFLVDRVMLDANVGYSDEFTYTGTDPETHAWLWDVNARFHFFPWDINLSPFVSAGLGGLTSTIEDNGSVAFLFEDDGGFLELGDPESGLRSVVLEDGDTFFGINYGGGVTADDLWGPVGLRWDIRGRTLPNFFGTDLSWLETTGGVTISWGFEEEE